MLEPPPPLLPLPPPPPQPMPAAATMSTSIPSSASQLRRFAGMPKKNTSVRTVPPADGQNSFIGRFRAVAPVVYMVSAEVCAEEPLIVTEAGERLHVAGSFAATGVMAQLKVTAAVNPFVGVTVMVEVFPVVAPGATETAVPAIVKVGVMV